MMSNATQTAVGGPTATSSSLSLPPRTLLYQQRVAFFDTRDPRHRDSLREWCLLQWETTFSKAFKSANSLYYHDCCCSFSKRGFMKQAGHPPMQTSTVMKIPAFKDVVDGETLYKWLLSVMSANTSSGRRVYFPALNRFHFDEDNSDRDISDEEAVTLRKRLDDVSESLHFYVQRAKKLEEDNQSLLASSKSWCQKYHELMDGQAKDAPYVYETPVKQKSKTNFDVYNSGH
jgi:hypothetical protein